MTLNWVDAAEKRCLKLNILLEALIDLYVWDLRSRGGPSSADFATARDVGERLAFTGDVFQWPDPKAEIQPPTPKQIAKALACGAWCPGGLNFAGRHWEVKPLEVSP